MSGIPERPETTSAVEALKRKRPDDAAVNELARQLNKYLGGGEPPIDLIARAREILTAVDDAVYDSALASVPKYEPLSAEPRDRRAYVARAATRLQDYANAAGVRLDWRIVEPHMWAIEPMMSRGAPTKLKEVDMAAVATRLNIFYDAVFEERDHG